MLERNLDRRAMGLTEYVLLVALIAIAALLAVKSFGWRVEEEVLGADVRVLEMEE